MHTYLDTLKHPFAMLETPFTFPALSATGLTASERRRVGSFIFHHLNMSADRYTLLQFPRPEGAEYYIQFGRMLSVENHHFIHLLSILTRYMGGAMTDDILRPFHRGSFPRFRTTRLYFHSRLIPIKEVPTGNPSGFVIVREMSVPFYVEKLRTFTSGHAPGPQNALFDAPDLTDANSDLARRLLKSDVLPNDSLYSPFVLNGFYVPQLNLLDMFPERLEEYAAAFSGILLGEEASIRRFESEYLNRIRFVPSLSAGGNPHWSIEFV